MSDQGQIYFDSIVESCIGKYVDEGKFHNLQDSIDRIKYICSNKENYDAAVYKDLLEVSEGIIFDIFINDVLDICKKSFYNYIKSKEVIDGLRKKSNAKRNDETRFKISSLNDKNNIDDYVEEFSKKYGELTELCFDKYQVEHCLDKFKRDIDLFVSLCVQTVKKPVFDKSIDRFKNDLVIDLKDCVREAGKIIKSELLKDFINLLATEQEQRKNE